MRIQIFINIAEKRNSLIVDEDTTLENVMRQLADKFLSGMNYKEIELSYGNMTLNHENHETLKQLGIQQGSTLTMIGLVHGGMPTESEIRFKENNLTPLKDHIKVTTSRDHPDVITFDDGDSPKRAIMPCGHAISPRSMTDYCEFILGENKNEFTCPSCEMPWLLNHVKHVACFNNDEWKNIESKIERLSLIKHRSYQQCPGCHMWLKKTNDSVEVVNCWNCSKTKGVKFNFCWKCLFQTNLETNECPKNCSTLKENGYILRTCPMKTIGSEQCPSVRRCPNCKLLIHHIDNCKHMTCRCGCQFCFVCLKFSLPGTEFNSHHNVPCNLASRQLSPIYHISPFMRDFVLSKFSL